MTDFANLADGGRRLAPILRGALAGRNVVVVDDGVETGTVAHAASAALAASGVASATLAAPVCSREAMASLQHGYDRIVAVVRPLVRRSLTWHYADFDVIDEEQALRLLQDLPAGVDLPDA